MIVFIYTITPYEKASRHIALVCTLCFPWLASQQPYCIITGKRGNSLMIKSSWQKDCLGSRRVYLWEIHTATLQAWRSRLSAFSVTSPRRWCSSFYLRFSTFSTLARNSSAWSIVRGTECLVYKRKRVFYSAQRFPLTAPKNRQVCWLESCYGYWRLLDYSKSSGETRKDR